MPGTDSDVTGVDVERDADGTVTFDVNALLMTMTTMAAKSTAGSGDWTSAVLTRANSRRQH